MGKKFNFTDYISELGKELVFEFNKAKLSTQSVAIGTNKESSAIKKLQTLLPEGVGVGSGFVYDSFGNVSRQCDIVIYEKDYCLKAFINDNERDVYYNCESVIAVGEVKTILNSEEFKDSLIKFAALEKLRRFRSKENSNASRQFLSKVSFVDSVKARETPRNEFDHIYKFILCEKHVISQSVMDDVIKDNVTNKDELFNSIISLNNKHVFLLNENKVCVSPYFASHYVIQNDANETAPFLRFMYHLITFILNGKTVPLNYQAYFEPNEDIIYNHSKSKIEFNKKNLE